MDRIHHNFPLLLLEEVGKKSGMEWVKFLELVAFLIDSAKP